MKIIREEIESEYKEKLSEIYEKLETLVQKKDVPKGMRISDGRKLAIINYTEWIKFQKYAEAKL